MSDHSDSALVALSRRGDASAFSALVRRHLRAAIAVGLAVLRDPSEAEDLAQDAFAVAYTSLAECRDPERFAPWLLSIVRNRGLNRLKQAKVRAAMHEKVSRSTVEPEHHLDRVVLREQLLAGLAQLTEMQREVVLLHDLESWTHAEIAGALEMSEVSSRQHLFNARKALRALLSADAEMEPHHG